MASRSMTPRIGIVSDSDAPETKMLVVIWGSPLHPHAEYIDPRVGPMPGGPHRAAMPAHFTSLAAFGGRADFESDGALRVTIVGPSNAVYPDGSHRRWQGAMDQAIGVRVKLAAPLMEAVRAQRPPAKAVAAVNDPSCQPFSAVSVEALIAA